jgi:hypothetical protein
MFAFALLLAATSPQSAHDDLLGRYTLVGEHGRVVCRFRFRYEPSVGGEIDAPAACAPVLAAADGLRWFAKPDGSYLIEDALHCTVATIASSEGGYILYVGERRYELAGVDYVAPPPPAKRAVGVWRVQNDAVPSRLLCRLSFTAGGAIGPATACPAPLRSFGGGRWRADEDGITLSSAGLTKRLSWEDDDDLNADHLHLAFIREKKR